MPLFDVQTVKHSFIDTDETSENFVSIFASGDLTLARFVEDKIKLLSPQYPFKKISDFLKEHDIVFGNLETPFSRNKPVKPLKDKVINFCVDPNGAEGLKFAGFSILSIANNHAMDYGSLPMLETIEKLENCGIQPVGAGKDIKDARKPVIIEKKGVLFGFLGYASLDEMTNAGKDKPGTSPLVLENVKEDIEELEKKVDFIVVSIHKGKEFMYYPQPQHQKDMRAVIDYGADIILGHHPHFPQGMEIYKSKLIFYSLSKLVFDEPYPNKYEASLFASLRNKIIGVIIKISKDAIVGFEVMPLTMSEDFQTSVMTGDSRLKTLKLIHDISIPLMTNDLERVYYRGGKQYLNAQFRVILSKLPSMGFKRLYRIFLWIISDEILRLIASSYFRIQLPMVFFRLKNKLLSLFGRFLKKS